MRLEGKTALITGAGSGMGRLACEIFAREGANIIATDISKQGLDETAALVTTRTLEWSAGAPPAIEPKLDEDVRPHESQKHPAAM